MVLKWNFRKEAIDIDFLINWLKEQEKGGATKVHVMIDEIELTDLHDIYPEIDDINIVADI
jgi:hypothetical protein